MTLRRCGQRTGSVFVNVLKSWIDVDSAGEITGYGYGGGGLIGNTTIRLGRLQHTFQNALLPDLRRDPERGEELSGGHRREDAGHG
jgi:hypothetical protein